MLLLLLASDSKLQIEHQRFTVFVFDWLLLPTTGFRIKGGWGYGLKQ
jgi:hypothetical protein